MIERKLQELQIPFQINQVHVSQWFVSLNIYNKWCCKGNKLDVLANEIQHDNRVAVIRISDEKTANTLSNVFDSLSIPYLMRDSRQVRPLIERYFKVDGQIKDVFVFSFPVHYTEDKLPLIEKETVLEAKLGLTQEDQTILPPNGATLIDAALVSTYIDTLRAHYHIVQKEKEAEKELCDQELSLDDELIPELELNNAAGDEEAVNSDMGDGQQIDALNVGIPVLISDSNASTRKSGKKKKQYDSSRKKSRKKDGDGSRDNQLTQHSHDPYEKKDSSRMGDMEAVENLAHDSIKYNQADHLTSDDAAGQAAAIAAGTNAFNGGNNSDNNLNGTSNSNVHSSDDKIRNVNKSDVPAANDTSNQNGAPKPDNTSKTDKTAKEDRASGQDKITKQDHPQAQDDLNQSEDSSRPDKRAYDIICSGGGNGNNNNNNNNNNSTDRTENVRTRALLKTLEDTGVNSVHAVIGTIKHGVQTSTSSSETPGGQQLSVYMRNSAPMISWAAQELNYGQMMQQASEAMHDHSFWVKVYAAKIDEKDLTIAQTKLNEMLGDAGLTEEDFEGKNIVEVQKTLDKLEERRSGLALMSDKDLDAWMAKNGKSVDDTVKDVISDYRQALKGGDHEEINKQFNALTDILADSKLSVSRMNRMMGSLDKDFAEAVKTATSMQQLLVLLKDKGHDEDVLDIIGKLSFDDLKGAAGLSIVKEALKDYNADLETKTKVMTELQALAHRNRIISAGRSLIYLNTEQLRALFDLLEIDKETTEKVLEIGWDRACRQPDLLNKIIDGMPEGIAKKSLEMVRDALIGQAARPSSLRRLSGKIAKLILKSAFGSTPGSDALWSMLRYQKVAKRIITMGLEIGERTSTKAFGANSRITRGLEFAKAPVKSITEKAAATKIGQKVAHSKVVTTTSNFAKGLSIKIDKARNIAHMPGRFVGKTTRWAARGAKRVLSTAVKNVVVSIKGAAAAAGSAASGALAGGTTVAGGWVVLLVVVVVVIFASMMSEEDTQEATVGNYQYAQFDTEFQAEIINDIQELNDNFEVKVNKAATDRAFWSSGTGFSETDSAAHFEAGAYSVLFRDYQGNELGRLDIDNSKAILDMAAQYCKYANWQKPADSASDEQKLAYEQIKQHYLDYCKLLWVSTHRVTLEEYRPGDEKYAEEDQSGLVTDSQGICPKNGTQVWLDDDFETGKLNDGHGTLYECGVDNGNAENPEGVCDPVPEDDAYMSYGQHALCSHPLGGKDGWHVVTDASGQPITRTHYICNMEHECRVCYDIEETEEVDEYGMGHTETYREYHTHYCGQHHYGEGNYSDDSVFSVENHRHTDYLWEYQCGGHMGAVVYLTVGDISRMKNMAPATDIDMTSLNDYPQETEGTTEEGE